VVGVARSSFYARREREGRAAERGHFELSKRGPKPVISDTDLLGLVKKDLEESPFKGEGHRKVWARLKFGKGLRVSRKRVLRIMREHKLLSPYRRPKGEERTHEGKIITHAPDVMWGTDATKVLTVEDGYGWVFIGVDHWNAECVGFHVCKRGDRFAALEPIAMGIHKRFGSVEAGAARGLTLRMDHGTQYLSGHFLNQVHAWGVATSFAFLEQPQTNGVAERFIRTLKEQIIYGEVFRNIEELRRAVSEFIERYNNSWLIGKNGFLSPYEARRRYFMKVAA
jgi:transposase InsO family protein